MKILITGGAGYLGSVLVGKCLALGYKVVVLDNFMYSETSLLYCCDNPNLEIIRGDCRNESLIKQLVSKVDAVIPLACLVGAPLCDQFPIESETINLDSIQLLLNCLSSSQKLFFPVQIVDMGWVKQIFFVQKNRL